MRERRRGPPRIRQVARQVVVRQRQQPAAASTISTWGLHASLGGTSKHYNDVLHGVAALPIMLAACATVRAARPRQCNLLTLNRPVNQS